MKTEIRNIEPNPFRRMKHYPIRRKKVEALKRSLQQTGFWDNVVGRLRGSKVEIAYGHHRWVALKEYYGAEHEVDIIIRDLSDEAMLQIMATENMEEWGTSFIVEMETVQAVVQAYAKGQIKLNEPSGDARKSVLRYAPSFIQGDVENTSSLRPYTALTIAHFLGWIEKDGKAQRKVIDALTALEFIQEGLVKEDDFLDLGTAQAQASIEEARREHDHRIAIAKIKEHEAAEARKEVEQADKRERASRSKDEVDQARKDRFRAEERRKAAELAAIEQRNIAKDSVTGITREINRAFRTGDVSVRGARSFAEGLKPRETGSQPEIEKYLRAALGRVSKMLNPDTELDNVLKYAESLDEATRIDASKTLIALAERATVYAKALWPLREIKSANQSSLRLK